MASLKQQSPLIQVELDSLERNISAGSENQLSVVEGPLLAYVNIRGRLDNSDFVSAAETVLGTALPKDNNTFVNHADLTILWFGPDEWLVLAPAGKQVKLLSALRNAFTDLFAAVTDVTGGYTCVDISGSAATDLLRKGSTIDFHPSVFGVGQCVQTLLGKTGVAIYKSSDTPSFRVVFRRSFADYLGLWLIDASREFMQDAEPVIIYQVSS